jgi:hypothetical protein
MNLHRLAIGLSAVNLVLLALILGRGLGSTPLAPQRNPQASPPAAPGGAPVLRGRALEIVDERGQIRSRLDVEAGGEVVLRLIDRNGTIRVKLGADEGGSGLLLLAAATEPGVHIIARRTGTPAMPATTSVTLRGADGQQQVIRP